MSDKYAVTAFSFWDFCLGVQDAVKQGYVFDDSNENMPQAYVGSYNCIMVKPQVAEVTETDTTEVKDVVKTQTATKTTRKTTK